MMGPAFFLLWAVTMVGGEPLLALSSNGFSTTVLWSLESTSGQLEMLKNLTELGPVADGQMMSPLSGGRLGLITLNASATSQENYLYTVSATTGKMMSKFSTQDVLLSIESQGDELLVLRVSDGELIVGSMVGPHYDRIRDEARYAGTVAPFQALGSSALFQNSLFFPALNITSGSCVLIEFDLKSKRSTLRPSAFYCNVMALAASPTTGTLYALFQENSASLSIFSISAPAFNPTLVLTINQSIQSSEAIYISPTTNSLYAVIGDSAGDAWRLLGMDLQKGIISSNVSLSSTMVVALAGGNQ